jgi:hypothetical protein
MNKLPHMLLCQGWLRKGTEFTVHSTHLSNNNKKFITMTGSRVTTRFSACSEEYYFWPNFLFFFWQYWGLNSGPGGSKCTTAWATSQAFLPFQVRFPAFDQVASDCDPPSSTSHMARITGMYHQAQPPKFHFLRFPLHVVSISTSYSARITVVVIHMV